MLSVAKAKRHTITPRRNGYKLIGVKTGRLQESAQSEWRSAALYGEELKKRLPLKNREVSQI